MRTILKLAGAAALAIIIGATSAHAMDVNGLCAGLGQSAKALAEMRDVGLPEGVVAGVLVSEKDKLPEEAFAILVFAVNQMYTRTPRPSADHIYQAVVTVCFDAFKDQQAATTGNGPALEIPQTK